MLLVLDLQYLIEFTIMAPPMAGFTHSLMDLNLQSPSLTGFTGNNNAIIRLWP